MRKSLYQQLWEAKPGFRNFINGRLLKTKNRVAIYEKLQTYTEDDMILNLALDTIYKSAAQSKRGYAFLVNRINDHVKNGATLSEAMEPYVPSEDVAIMKAGDVSGKLAGALEKLVTSLTKMREMVKNASIKAVVFFVYLALSIGLSTYISISVGGTVEQVMSFAPNVQLSGASEGYLNYGKFMKDYYPFVIGIIVAIIISVMIRLPKGKGKLREFLQKYIMPFTTYRQFVVSRFYLSWSTLEASGMKMNDSVSLLRRYASNYLDYYLSIILNRLRNAEPPKEAFFVELFDLETRNEFSAYSESSKNLSVAVEKMAKNQLVKAESSINRAATIGFVLITAILSAIIIWTGLTMFEVLNVIKAGARTI